MPSLNPPESSSHPLPPAADFIAPSTQVSSLTRSSENLSFVEGIRDAARNSGVWVSVGVHEPPSAEQDKRDESEGRKGRCYNTQLLIDAKGDILDKYRKVGVCKT